jgi:hypothetical protein
LQDRAFEFAEMLEAGDHPVADRGVHRRIEGDRRRRNFGDGALEQPGLAVTVANAVMTKQPGIPTTFRGTSVRSTATTSPSSKPEEPEFI